MFQEYQVLYATVVVATCFLTFWAGDKTERFGVVIVLIASLASYPVTVLVDARWHREMLGAAAIDGATTIAFFVLMVRSRMFWPIWSFGFCMAMMAAHAMRWVKIAVPAWSYYDTTSLWAYPIMASIIAGPVERKWGLQITAFWSNSSVAHPRDN